MIENGRRSWATGPPDEVGGPAEPGGVGLLGTPPEVDAPGVALAPGSPLMSAAPAKPRTPATMTIGTRMASQRIDRGVGRGVRVWIGAVTTSGVPHDGQKRRLASFSVRQAGQMMPGGPAG